MSVIASYALLSTSAFAEEATLDPIVVSADFREAKLSETADSVTVIGEEEIYDKASAGFEEVIGKAPNVNNLYDFLDQMYEMFKDEYKHAMRRTGLKNLISEDYLYLEDKPDITDDGIKDN